MSDLIITSLRGGANNTDPAIAIPEDQCVAATNVEFVESMLGERRRGTDAITLPSFLSARDRITFIFRHLPSADETGAQLWALGVTGTASANLGYKTTAWTEVTISDTPTLTGFSQYRWQAVILRNGKILFAYDSNVDRLHVWDGTTMRRAGMAEPSAAPTAAESGGVGTLAGTRYGRIRELLVSGTTVIKSEPSDALTFALTGTTAAITWTKPALTNTTATHWEIELSTDNANFYVMSRIAIGTSTYTDTATFSAGYTSGTLSEDTGDYALQWSARFLTVDQDRPMWAGSWESEDFASTVGWSPVYGADGDGNDERMETDTDPTLTLDAGKYGRITGLSAPCMGAIWVTKQHAVYKLTRTGQRTAAYEADLFSDAIGAIDGSLISGVDEVGQPCLYAIDFEQGPYRVGVGGIKRSGEDLRATWQTLNINATAVVTSACYYPKKKQAIWNLSTGSSNTPDTTIVLHVDKSRSFADGVRKGWSIWTGNRAKALSMCLYASNIDDDAARNLNLVPYIGLEGLGLIHRCDTGVDDNGVAYAATITTRPYTMKSIQHQFEVRSAALLGKATTGAAVDVTCVRDFGLEDTVTVSDVSFTATASETDVIASLDNFKGAEMHVGQFEFSDVDNPTAQWQLNRFDVTGTDGQKA
jgi:hypothetical protein